MFLEERERWEGGVMGMYAIVDKGGNEGTREFYDRVLGDIKDLTIEMKDRTKDVDRIKIMYMETSTRMEGKILVFLQEQSKLKTRVS